MQDNYIEELESMNSELSCVKYQVHESPELKLPSDGRSPTRVLVSFIVPDVDGNNSEDVEIGISTIVSGMIEYSCFERIELKIQELVAEHNLEFGKLFECELVGIIDEDSGLIHSKTYTITHFRACDVSARYNKRFNIN